MSQLGTVYATKRRRRNGKSLKPQPKDGVTKSNPSKRHRERLNAELDLLASLLPFEQNILSKLDRLSILRLSVSYLRTKSYFQVVMHKEKDENGMLSHIHSHDAYRSRELGILEHSLLDGDMFLQALNGFLMILTCDGEVFFATHSIESYLGFHQSDIVHQSVYELVHSEDREELQRQLLWNSFLPQDMTGLSLAESLSLDKSHLLERSFTVRFRCLLDNTSGFLRLDIRGRVKILHGQNRKTEEPPLALFAYCTPFGPPSLLEIPQKENMFKSKHKLDLSLVSMDQRGKLVLGFSDSELATMGGYDLVHYDDLSYVASAHQELLKTGASGMIAYRFQKKDGEWQWLQTSSRLVYKNSKPDFVISTHRQLMEEEGRDLLGKRTMDFKVSYLDTGLSSTYFSEADQIIVPPTTSPNSLASAQAISTSGTPQRANRRYKTQLRDFLSTCQRTKRGKNQSQANTVNPLPPTPSPSVVDYIPDPAVAVAAAYSNLNPMYSGTPYAPTAENIYMTSSVHSSNFYPENIFHQYRLQGVSGYYPDYHHHHHHHNSTAGTASPYMSSNGFLPYDNYGLAASKEDKWQESAGKYYSSSADRNHVYSGYSSPALGTPNQIIQSSLKTPKSSPSLIDSNGPHPPAASSTDALASGGASPMTIAGSGSNDMLNRNSSASTIVPKSDLSPTPPQDHYEQQRQTVLMWGSTSVSDATSNRGSQIRSPITTTMATNGTDHQRLAANIVMSLQQQQQQELDNPHQPALSESQLSISKWNGGFQAEISLEAQTSSYHGPQHRNQQCQSENIKGPSGEEVWRHASPTTAYHHSQYQYFTYHSPAATHHHHHHYPSTQSAIGYSPPVDCHLQSMSRSRSVLGSNRTSQSPSHYPATVTTTSHSGHSGGGNSASPASPVVSPHSQHLHHQQQQHPPIVPAHHQSHVTRFPTRTGVLCCPSLR